MERVLFAPDCGDRYAVFERFSRIAGLASGSNEDLARQYGDRCRALIAACPDMPGVDEAMAALHKRQFRLFVNSATPEIELRPIVQARGLSRLLAGVFGGPATKVENLQRILTLLGEAPRNLVVVGDGIDDHAAAEQIGCPFVPVFANADRMARLRPALRDLSQLPATIEHLYRHCEGQVQKSMNAEGNT
jgi:phosphoglycolate phosphatase-like HAD superfamily hydrolase